MRVVKVAVLSHREPCFFRASATSSERSFYCCCSIPSRGAFALASSVLTLALSYADKTARQMGIAVNTIEQKRGCVDVK